MADPRSVRLIFRYDGDQVELLSRQPVDMVSPPSGPLGEFADRLGTWVEVRDGQDSALHRQILSDPVRASAEVFSPEPEENLSPGGADAPDGRVHRRGSRPARGRPRGARHGRRSIGSDGRRGGPGAGTGRSGPRVLRFPLHGDDGEPGGRP